MRGEPALVDLSESRSSDLACDAAFSRIVPMLAGD